jgi:ribosomal protein S18 acetylase RimI-like enzyme
MTIAYRDGHDFDLEQLAHLFVTAGWPHRAADRSKLALLVSRSLYVSTAHDGDKLVAFARALSDGVSNAYISTVCVLPDYRGRGIGREVVRRMVEREGGTGIRWVLHARKELHPFYGLNGFVEASEILWRDRR